MPSGYFPPSEFRSIRIDHSPRTVRTSRGTRTTTTTYVDYASDTNFFLYAPSHEFSPHIFRADVDKVRQDFSRLLTFPVNANTTEDDLRNLLFHLKHRMTYWTSAEDFWYDQEQDLDSDESDEPFDEQTYLVRRHLRRHLHEIEAHIPPVESWLVWKQNQRLAAEAAAQQARGPGQRSREHARRERPTDTSSFSRFYSS